MSRRNSLKLTAALAVVAALALGWRASAGVAGYAGARNANAQSANQNAAVPAGQPPTGQPPAGQPGGPPQGGPLADLLESIKGKEELPAEQVFKNIKQLKGVPAGRVLRAMGSFTRALGVNCAHCHVPREWEKDDKPTKDIARGMIRMVGAINNEQLKSIPNLRPEATVSCSTCHRGQTRPDPSLPGARPGGGGGGRPSQSAPTTSTPPSTVTPTPTPTRPPVR